jgi:hypothetical protein
MPLKWGDRGNRNVSKDLMQEKFPEDKNHTVIREKFM